MAQYSQNLIGMPMGGYGTQATRMSALGQMAGNRPSYSQFAEKERRKLGLAMATPRGTTFAGLRMGNRFSPRPQPVMPNRFDRVNPIGSSVRGRVQTPKMAPVGSPRRTTYEDLQVGGNVSDDMLLNRDGAEFFRRLQQLGRSSPEGRAWAEELARRQRGLMKDRVENMQILPGDRARSRFRDTFAPPRSTL
jgi:hypothetical protein